MAKTFGSAAAFKASLEARLRKRAVERSLPLQTVQLRFVMERLLARLFHEESPPWLLKGGYAMDLRYRPRARTTKDIDLSVSLTSVGEAAGLRDRLQAAADRDLGDYLVYRIGELKSELTNAPAGGGRYPCEAMLVGKSYAKLHIDVGIGDTVFGEPERLIGEDLLDFAGIAPALALAIPKAQQFAEKLHAYTYPWEGRVNTRSKDLVDLVLLIERGGVELAGIRSALEATFSTRGTHELPVTLAPPPPSWAEDFPPMAEEAGLGASELGAAFAVLERFWTDHSLGER